MQSVSQRFLDALTADSLNLYCRADIYEGINGKYLGSFSVLDGTIQLDVNNAARRQLQSLTATTTDDALPGLDLIPQVPEDVLFPDGNEIMVWKGVLYSDAPGDHEEVSLGRFLIEEVDVTHSAGAVTIEVTGMDRAETVHRAEAYVPVTFPTLVVNVDSFGATDPIIIVNQAPAGVFPYFMTCVQTGEVMLATGASLWTDGVSTAMNVVRAQQGTTGASSVPGAWLVVFSDVTIQAMIDFAVPGLMYNFQPTGVLIAAPAFNIGDDLMAGAMTAAATSSADLFFDPFGNPTLIKIIDPATQAPSVNFAAGPNSIMDEATNKKNNTTVPNVIVVTAQGSGLDVPLTSVWWDSDPASFTYYGPAPPPALPQGEYPTTTKQMQTALATQQSDVDNMAQSAGLAAKNLFDSVIVAVRDFPPLDGIDVMSVNDPQAKIYGDYTCDQIAFPLGTSAKMSVTGRKVA